MPETSFDIAIIGAGPAGLSAAKAASAGGASVVMLDHNPTAGGQVWRAATNETPRLLGALKRQGVALRTSTSVFDIQRHGDAQFRIDGLNSDDSVEYIQARTIILAVGARERLLPFPGWTLPNVIGVGALKSLIVSGFEVRGRRIVIAGTSPLLLAVAAAARLHGADVALIAEQAPMSCLLPFALRLFSTPAKLVQAVALRVQLRGTPYRLGSWPVRAEGTDRVERVWLANGRREYSIECDLLACAFGLTPNLQLPFLLGCRIECGFVAVDDLCRTSVSGVFCAGETTGIGGVEKSLAEGTIAGLAAAGAIDDARRAARRLPPHRAFVRALEAAFAPRSELRRLPADETVICRCEDIRLGAIRRCRNWRDAKLQTRCGMGPCQGRICAPAIEFLLGWSPGDTRPPIFPVPLRALTSEPAKESPR